MGVISLALATLLYFIAAASFALRRDWPMCLVFGAYGAANIGLIIVAYRTL